MRAVFTTAVLFCADKGEYLGISVQLSLDALALRESFANFSSKVLIISMGSRALYHHKLLSGLGHVTAVVNPGTLNTLTLASMQYQGGV